MYNMNHIHYKLIPYTTHITTYNIKGKMIASYMKYLSPHG